MLYMGGARRGVRGYSPGSISPFFIDQNGYKVRVGGDRLIVNSIEASIPMDFISNSMKITWDFLDSLAIGFNKNYQLSLKGLPKL